MSSQRAKNIRMREQRAVWEEEVRQRSLDFLKKERARRNAEKKKAEAETLERKKLKSRLLALENGKLKPVVKKKNPKRGPRVNGTDKKTA